MKAIARLALSCAALSVLGACGQKGPLYLPEKPGNVITRPAADSSEGPPETAPQPATKPPAQEPDTATEKKKPNGG